MQKYTYNVYGGSYNNFMQAYNKLSYIDDILVCTDNAKIHKLYTIADIKQYFNIDADTICFIYFNQANKLFIMNKSLYHQAIYMLCSNAFQYYYFTQFEYTNIDIALYSNIELSFEAIENIPLDKLHKAYTIGSQVASALTDLCYFNKLGGYSINQVSLHKGGDYCTIALFEQAAIMLNNILLYGKLI